MVMIKGRTMPSGTKVVKMMRLRNTTAIQPTVESRFLPSPSTEKLKRHQHEVEILTHEEVHDDQHQREKEEGAEHTAMLEIHVVEDDAVDEKPGNANVKNAEKNALLQVDLDGVPEVLPHEKGLALDDTAQIQGKTCHNGTEGHGKNNCRNDLDGDHPWGTHRDLGEGAVGQKQKVRHGRAFCYKSALCRCLSCQHSTVERRKHIA